jgi:ACT domain-containing protein
MRAIITVIGKDRRGIIAGVSTILADNDINILDISQTIMQEYFTMMMLVELSEMMVSLAELIELLQHKGQELGVSIKVQHEDIFQSMHRI